MEKEDIRKITEADDPNRCQAVNAHGQCTNLSVPEGTNCMVHGGNKQIEAAERKSLDNYRLTKWNVRLHELKNSDHIKGLRDEIAILRIMLEERFNGVEDAHDLILQSGPISDLILKVEKVVTSANKLEGSMNMHLDKSAIIQFASQVVDIIASEVNDPETVKRISERLLEVMNQEEK